MDLQSFQLYHDDGTVHTTATPIFLAYKDRSGAIRTPPLITHRGAGIYEFSPSDDDLTIGVAWLTDNGPDGFPSNYFGSICQRGDPFATMVFQTETGGLVDLSSSPPIISTYKDRAGVDGASPALVNVHGGYLWTLTPSINDSVAGILYDVSAPDGYFPSHYSGNLIVDVAPVYTVPQSIPSAPASTDYEGLFAVFAAKRGTSAILSYQEWLLRFK